MSLLEEEGCAASAMKRRRVEPREGSSPPGSLVWQESADSLGTRIKFSRREYIQLLQGALSGLGYPSVAASLRAASGVAYESAEASVLREHITRGRWGPAAASLASLSGAAEAFSTEESQDGDEEDGDERDERDERGGKGDERGGERDEKAFLAIPFSAPPPRAYRAACLLVLEEKFLDLLWRDRPAAALECLRSELRPLCASGPSYQRLHALARLLVRPTPTVSCSRDARPSRRRRALLAVSAALPPGAFPPPCRLLGLLQQALARQERRCALHSLPALARGSAAPPASLLRDHACGSEALPAAPLMRLRAEPGDEVWHLAFSHAGRALASASRDGSVCVWELWEAERGEKGGEEREEREDRDPDRRGAHGSSSRAEATGSPPPSAGKRPFQSGRSSRHLLATPGRPVCWDARLRHRMRGHALPVSLVAWSPGDRYVASCSQDCTARLWDAREGTCARVLRHHAQSVTCLAFCPALAGLVTGSHDRSLALLGLQGGLRRRWSAGRMQEVVVAKRFFALCASGERSVAVVDLRSEGDAPEGDSEVEEGGLGFGGEERDWNSLDEREFRSRDDRDWNLRSSRDRNSRSSRGRNSRSSRDRNSTTLSGLSPSSSPPGDSSFLALPATAFAQDEPLISMCLCRQDRFLLLSLASAAIRLYDLGPDPEVLSLPRAPAALFLPPAPAPGRFVVRACLGGIDERFVLSGSEDATLHLWHRVSGQHLGALAGHRGTVNAVAWSPADPQLCASASDDGSVILWTTRQRADGGRWRDAVERRHERASCSSPEPGAAGTRRRPPAPAPCPSPAPHQTPRQPAPLPAPTLAPLRRRRVLHLAPEPRRRRRLQGDGEEEESRARAAGRFDRGF